MNIEPKALFKVVGNGRQSGCFGKWNHTLMAIISKWDTGSNREKFEVLAAEAVEAPHAPITLSANS